MPGDTFTCALCGGTFESDRSDADSIMEFQELFTEEMRAADDKPPVVVCDDCHQVLLKWKSPAEAFEEIRRRRSAAGAAPAPRRRS